MKSSTLAILGLVALHAVPKILDIECPRCRSWCTLSEVKRTETGFCSMTAKRNHWLRYSKDVPIIRTYYEVTYLCRRCGETVIRQEYSDRQIMTDKMKKCF